MASAVATVGSARPFFSWFTCARSSAARDASSPSVQPRVARSRERVLRLTPAPSPRGAGGGKRPRSARPTRRAPPRRGTRLRAADWRPRPEDVRGAVAGAAYGARARPRRCPVAGAARAGGSAPPVADGAARPEDGSRRASRQGQRLHWFGTTALRQELRLAGQRDGAGAWQPIVRVGRRVVGRRDAEDAHRVFAEAAKDARLAVPCSRAERGLRRRPGREAEGDRERADLGARVRRRAVVARRVGAGQGRGPWRARGALVRPAVAPQRRRVTDRARLDGGVMRAHGAWTASVRDARETGQARRGGAAPLRQEVEGQVDLEIEGDAERRRAGRAVSGSRDGHVLVVADRAEDTDTCVRDRGVRNRQRRPEQARALMVAAFGRIAVGADVSRRAGVAVVVLHAVEVTVRVRGAAEADLAPRAGAAAADSRPRAAEGRAVAGAGGRRRAGAEGVGAGPDVGAGIGRAGSVQGEHGAAARSHGRERNGS